MDVFSMLMRVSAAAITAFDTVSRFLDRSNGDDDEQDLRRVISDIDRALVGMRIELRDLHVKVDQLHQLYDGQRH